MEKQGLKLKGKRALAITLVAEVVENFSPEKKYYLPEGDFFRSQGVGTAF